MAWRAWPRWALVSLGAVGWAGSAGALAQGPAFDCTQARGSVEQMICADPALAARDRQMAAVYAAALRKAGQEHPPTLRAEQRGWAKGRNDCWKATDPKACVVAAYQRRTVELQARYRLVPALPTVRYVCDGNPADEVIATYFQTDPPSLLAERGDQTSLMLQAPSASGARYQGRNESLWEHQGEATIVWGFQAPEMRCQVAPEARLPVADTAWELVAIQSMDDAQGTLRVAQPQAFTLRLGAKGEAIFRLGCNRGTAPWTAKPSAEGVSGSLSFGPLARTRALCPGPALAQAERRLLRDLPHVRSYLLKDGRLFLSLKADGGVYEWRAAAP